MANWNEVRSKAKTAASKAVKKTGEVADLASMYMRVKALEHKRNTKYQALGKLTYRQLKSGESYAEQIAPVVEELDSILEKLREQVAEIEAVKKAQAEKKAQKEAQKESEKEEPTEK